MSVDFSDLADAVVDAFGQAVTIRVPTAGATNYRTGTKSPTNADHAISGNVGPSRIVPGLTQAGLVEELTVTMKKGDVDALGITLDETCFVLIVGRDTTPRGVVAVERSVEEQMIEVRTQRLV